jgi:hypothetical protein
MPVIKEYCCDAHGPFEAQYPVCPAGCKGSLIKRAFYTAPGVVSERTKGTDKSLRGLASEYGLTNMSNNQGTQAIRQADQKTLDFQAMFAPRNVGVNQGATYMAGGGIKPGTEGRGNGAMATAAGMRVTPGNPLVKSETGGVSVALPSGQGINLAPPTPHLVARPFEGSGE